MKYTFSRACIGLHRPGRSFTGVLLFCILLLGATSCGTPQATTTAGKIPLTLWYVKGTINDKLLADAGKHFPNIHLQTVKIGGNYIAKVKTVLAGQANVPDVMSMPPAVAAFFPDEDQFVDLYSLGARSAQYEYLDWKWQQGVAPDGKMIAFPMDTGPTALYYRADIFKQAGLPTDPTAVSARIATWDDLLSAAEQVKNATKGKVYLTDSMYSVFSQVTSQLGKSYFEPSGRYIGDQSHIKQAWDTAVKFHRMGLSPGLSLPPSTDWNVSVNNGTVAGFVGAVWEQKYLMQGGPETAGKWRVARTPGGDGNNGGSFISITKYSQHPKEAFALIKWLLSPQNQLRSFLNESLFPSTPSIFGSPKMAHVDPFFGGQNISTIFSQSAAHVKPIYFDPENGIVDTIFRAELLNVDVLNKDPQVAWNDAQREIQRELSI